jgi:hypothetical protein
MKIHGVSLPVRTSWRGPFSFFAAAWRGARVRLTGCFGRHAVIESGRLQSALWHTSCQQTADVAIAFEVSVRTFDAASQQQSSHCFYGEHAPRIGML